ncbi:dimethylaniline monooxygenase [n-oxide-forming] [Plakobranchus ocellatus]|uniref:Flavin-containing monooxygenase n=1 Tax=Plakobranchus ocellatus TaxID=259542 RepID=A0AAV4CPE5_9GAST|nr:dimethylaniline monooxygenase [n-oxide-forming] [Plakobranchus ocellatus]
MVSSQRYSILVDFVSFMDELSALVGCSPNPFAMLVKDPRLALNLLFGPVYPYTYRLCGPGKWSGAREAILTAWDRVEAPFKTRPLVEAAKCDVKYQPKQMQRYLLWVFMFFLMASFAVALF